MSSNNFYLHDRCCFAFHRCWKLFLVTLGPRSVFKGASGVYHFYFRFVKAVRFCGKPIIFLQTTYLIWCHYRCDGKNMSKRLCLHPSCPRMAIFCSCKTFHFGLCPFWLTVFFYIHQLKRFKIYFLLQRLLFKYKAVAFEFNIFRVCSIPVLPIVLFSE